MAEGKDPSLAIAYIIHGMTPLQLDEFAEMVEKIHDGYSFTEFRTHLQVWAGRRVEFAEQRRRPGNG